MRHSLFGGVAATALFALMISAAPASAQGSSAQSYRANHAMSPHNAYRPGDFHRGDGRDYGRRFDYGAGLAAGVAGLAAGAVIGGALDQDYGYYPDGYYQNGYYANGPYPAGPYANGYVTDPDEGYVQEGPTYAAPGPQVAGSDDTVAYCERTFRSYDPASGTYLGYDGMRHSCP